MRLSHKLLMILCLSGTALSLPARAEPDVPPAAAALFAAMERQTTMKPSFDDIATDGSGNITVSKLTLSQPATGDEPSITMRIDEMVLSNVEDQGNGRFRIGSASFSNIQGDVSGSDFSLSFSIPESDAEGWLIQHPGETPSAGGQHRMALNLANRMAAGKMTLGIMGQSVTIDGYEQTWDGDPDTGAGSYAMKVTNIAVPEQALVALDQGGMLKQLGYSGLNFDIQGSGRVDRSDDAYGLDMSFGITSRNMGTLSLGISAAGIPQAVMDEFNKANAERREPDFTALMPQVQSISIGSASFRFEDASITKKLLPMIAAMQGMDEATLINMAGPMLQMSLMQLQNQAFVEQAARAVDSFLKDPKSITIAAKPATPVTIAEIMTLDPGAPGAAITRLGVGVTAND